jgi:hypothetical protein
MTDKQREAHEAWVTEIAGLIGRAVEDDISSDTIARWVFSFVADRLSDVTNEMESAGRAKTGWHPNDVFRAMLRASALFPGDRT